MVVAAIIGAGLIAIAITFGNAAGVGGAGIIVPVLLLIYSLDILEASALSNFIICIGFALRYYFNYKERHPTRNKPVIDYDTASLMLPASLLGTKFGVIIHDIFPRPLLFIMLTITLLYLSYCSLKRGNKLSEAENIALAQKESKSSPMYTEDIMSDDGLTPADNGSESNRRRIKEIEEEEARPLPPKKTALILVLFVFLMISIIVEGSKGLPSPLHIGLCSPGYWVSFFIFIAISSIIVMINARDINTLSFEKRVLGFKVPKDDIDWNWPKIIQYSIYGLIAGILSAIFGIGGGMILSPVLVQLNMKPQVVSATGGLFVLFTTAASSSVLIYEGYWVASYGIILGTVSLLSSVLSVWVVSGLIKKYGKPSIIVYIMAVVVFLSGFIISGVGFYQDYRKYGTIFSGAEWRFHNYCSGK